MKILRFSRFAKGLKNMKFFGEIIGFSSSYRVLTDDERPPRSESRLLMEFFFRFTNSSLLRFYKSSIFLILFPSKFILSRCFRPLIPAIDSILLYDISILIRLMRKGTLLNL